LEPATVVGSRSILPDLVEDKDLDAANMLWSFSLNLSLVIGPALCVTMCETMIIDQLV
jgi:hypothetical protein